METKEHENGISRSEWESYTADEKFRYVKLIEDARECAEKVLREIPECPDHGFCLPYYSNWIRKQRGLPVSKSEEMLNFDRAATKLLRSGFLG